MIDKNINLINFHVLTLHCHIYMNSNRINNKHLLEVQQITDELLALHFALTLGEILECNYMATGDTLSFFCTCSAFTVQGYLQKN